MNAQDKLAIENLIIIASYMEENSVLTDVDEKILKKSISHASNLIGISAPECAESIELCEVGEFEVEAIVTAIKNRKNN